MSGASGWGAFGQGVALAAGLVLAATVLSTAVLDAKREGRSLEVKGFAERSIDSNWAEWTGRFTTRGESLRDASLALSTQREIVRAFLLEQGAKAEQFSFLPAMTEVLFARGPKGYTTNRVEGYALHQEVRLRSADIDGVTRVSEDASELAQQGIEFSSERPQYLYTELGSLKIEMLAEATADARRRAEVLAEKSESRVGPLRYARQGVFQITPANSTEVSDYGHNDTTSREKSIKAVVTIRYAIED